MDNGLKEAARFNIGRSDHWPVVEREARAAHPHCAACINTQVTDDRLQVHHINPFHYVVALGRPDLELDQRNLICLCETEEGKPAPDHHVLIGHLGNFKLGNLLAAQDAAGRYHGLSQDDIRGDAAWSSEERDGRLKALDLMTDEEKRAYRAQLDQELPADSNVLTRFGLTIGPYQGG